MAKYIPYDYNQNAMVVINFNDQIQLGIFEHALHYKIGLGEVIPIHITGIAN